MKPLRLNDKIRDYSFLGFLIPFFAMVLVMIASDFTPFGNSSMLYSDKYHQYFPFFKAFRRSILNGESLIYNWDVGMGMDYLGLAAYYLASPLNLLSILVPESWLLGYFEMLVPIRLGLAGLFFAIFLKKLFGKTDFSIAVFGSLYALCAWALGYQWNVMWMDTFALLPLVALGTVSLLRDKKFMLYTFTLFLSVFSNYYIGFFTCIFVFLVFFCYEICRWKGFKRFFLDLCRIALFSVLAIGMTALLELPALSALGTTQSSVNKFPENFSMNIAERELYSGVNNAWEAAKTAWADGQFSEAISQILIAAKGAFAGIMNGMRQVAGNMNAGIEPTFKEGLPNLYCGIGSVLLGFLFLTSGKVKLRDKLCSMFLLVFIMLSFLLRQLDYIWHGFHFTNMIPYRFSFLFSFIVLYMAYRAYLLRHSFKLWQLGIAGVLAIGIFLCSNNFWEFIDKMKDPSFHDGFSNLLDTWTGSDANYTSLSEYLGVYSFIFFNGLFLILYFATLGFLYWPKRLKPNATPKEISAFQERAADRRRLCSGMLLFVMCVELMINLANFAINFTGTSVKNYPKGTQDTAAVIRLMDELEKDTLFYRAETTHSQTLNDGALNGYNGISTFTSSANVRVTEFTRALGYGAKNTYNRYCFEESSPVANLFLDLKYMIERDGKVEANPYFDDIASSGNVHLLQNNAYLPLGFLANTELKDVDFSMVSNRFYLQNQLIQSSTGITQDVWRPLVGDCLNVTVEDENAVTLRSASQTGTASYKANKKGTLIFTYTSDKEGLLCIDINQTKRNAFSVWHNGSLLYNETYSLPQMVSVCTLAPGDEVQVKFTCTAGDTGSITVNANVLDESLFRQAYDILNASTLELTKFEDTYIEGTIDCNRDGLLYTSIPQNAENWSVTVDGKEAPIVLVGDAMIGVELTEGAHKIAFTYHNRAFTVGLIVSLACFATLMALWYFLYKPKFKMPDFKKWFPVKKESLHKK